MEYIFFFKLSIKLVLGFFALMLTTKILGRRALNQITPFDFISSMVLGELLGNAIYDVEIGFQAILYGIFFWSFLMYLIEKITQKFPKSRGFLEGKPSILIRNGQIDYDELKKQMMDIDELLGLLRTQNVFSVREVQYAILEANGFLSVLKKSCYDCPNRMDFKMENQPTYLSVVLVADGILIPGNLKICQMTEKQLLSELNQLGYKKISDVMYAEWKKDQGLHVNSYKSSPSNR